MSCSLLFVVGLHREQLPNDCAEKTVNVVILRHNDLRTDARTRREASALGVAGYSVTVLALQGPGLPEREEGEGYSVWRVGRPSTASATRPLAKVAQSRERESAIVRAAVDLRPDVVHAHDTDTLEAGWRVKRLTGAKLVWGADELFPEMLVANRPHVPPWVLSHWRRVERRLVPKTDAVITVGDALASELHSRYGVDPIVVRNVPVLEPLGDRTRLRRSLGLGDDQVILLYQGLINVGRGLEQLVEILPRVPRLHFVLQGFGPAIEAVLARANACGVADRVYYVGSAPIEELNEWASGADIGDLLIENLSLNNYLAAPNKLFQYMMASIPTLASDFPEMSALLSEGPCGVVADPADPAAVAAALGKLIDSPEWRHEMGARARHLAETRYNWDVEQQKLLVLYEQLAPDSTM